jgi:hypothetical protein
LVQALEAPLRPRIRLEVGVLLAALDLEVGRIFNQQDTFVVHSRAVFQYVKIRSGQAIEVSRILCIMLCGDRILPRNTLTCEARIFATPRMNKPLP